MHLRLNNLTKALALVHLFAQCIAVWGCQLPYQLLSMIGEQKEPDEALFYAQFNLIIRNHVAKYLLWAIKCFKSFNFYQIVIISLSYLRFAKLTDCKPSANTQTKATTNKNTFILILIHYQVTLI